MSGTLTQFANRLSHRFSGCITGNLHTPAVAAQYGQFPEYITADLVKALASRGITRPYIHQEQCWSALEAGRNVVLMTPTASGKSLCYNVPVINAATQARTKALYMFPTKALSQDQVAEILELNRAADLGVRAFTFDGDTPADARKAVRTRGDIVVTNPDMLHQAILPHHTKWAQFFEQLKYIVVDELHTYRGVFGSHVANVMRRLDRICRFYGVSPQWIACSATLANPREHAEDVFGRPFELVDRSGAPQGARSLLLWNPPVVNEDLGIRASARSQSVKIAGQAVASGLKTIVFAQTRLMVEVITKYLKDRFDNDPRKPARIAAYRGGYLPTERRAAEQSLRAGHLDCVISTSALELGVDIGSLDVCVLNGYPGSIAATLQRFGRAGRRQKPTLGVLVANSSPLDQYVVQNPEFFFDSSPEHARIAPNQLLILLDHVRCAAFELPFAAGESFGGQDIRELLDYLADAGVVHLDGDQWHWIEDSYPAGAVNLRSVADGNFVVVDTTDGAKNIIAEVDFSSAALTIYEGAIYMVQAQPWQIEKLDWTGRKAFATRTKVDYYTDSIDYSRLKILEEFDGQRADGALTAHGEVHLVRRVTGYKKIRYYTHENIGYGPIELPDQEIHTTSLWWRLSAENLSAGFDTRALALDGLIGAAHALHTVATIFTMSDPRDIGQAVGDGAAKWSAGQGGAIDQAGRNLVLDQLEEFSPCIFLYDNFPGGVGLSEPLYDSQTRLLDDAARLINRCRCAAGCPACVGPVTAGEARHDSKQASLSILALLNPSGQATSVAAEPDLDVIARLAS